MNVVTPSPFVVDPVRAANRGQTDTPTITWALGYAPAYLRGMKSSFSYLMERRRRVFLPNHADARDIH
jgi:hypothetical protein